MPIINAVSSNKTVADPIAEYLSLKPLWIKSKAVCSGERFVKDFDNIIDRASFKNLLIPFSPNMTELQYQFYKAEAELPGITSNFAKTLVGGLLRKMPILKLPDEIPEEVTDWILNEFSQDDAPLISFLDTALWEEIQTSRAWVYVDYPKITDIENRERKDFRELKPYPVLWHAECIINWHTETDMYGKSILKRIIIRTLEEDFSKNEFHAEFVDTVKVHELDENGYYQIRIFQKTAKESDVPVVSGAKQVNIKETKEQFVLVEVIDNILNNGKRLDMIPAWPLNGKIEAGEPILMPFIDKEIALYNKMSRRNHLLYGASTYTPWIASEMIDEDFDSIVNSGLGTWIRLRQGDTIGVLDTPTAALADMDRSITAAFEEMAKMGIRMLSPEVAQSGVALEIRNAAQTAQLGTLNTKISNIMKQIISFMINWRYNLNLDSNNIKFQLSSDFSNIPTGEGWLRLATEWYQSGLLPRSVWLEILKHNDMVPADYNDDQGQQEMTVDESIKQQKELEDYAQRIEFQNSLGVQGA